MAVTLPKPVEVEAVSPLGEAVPPARHPSAPVAAQSPPLAELQIEPARLLVASGYSLILFFISLFAELIANLTGDS